MEIKRRGGNQTRREKLVSRGGEEFEEEKEGGKKKNPILGNADRVCTMEVSRRILCSLRDLDSGEERERKKERVQF